MRNRFATACSTLGAGVAVTTMLSLSVAGAASASVRTVHPNQTPACGKSCTEVYSLLLGTKTIINAYVPGDTGGGAKAGQPIVLQRQSDSHPNQDFTNNLPAGTTVASFCPPPGGDTNGGVYFSQTSVACRSLTGNPVMEWAFTPYGNDTGLCIGVASGEVSGEKLTLQPCGESVRTLFIADTTHSRTVGTVTYNPYINGGDSRFSHPLVLTVDEGSARPANQLKLEPERFLTGGRVSDTQQFATK